MMKKLVIQNKKDNLLNKKHKKGFFIKKKENFDEKDCFFEKNDEKTYYPNKTKRTRLVKNTVLLKERGLEL